MKKMITISVAALVAMFAFSAVASAKPNEAKQAAKAQCKAEKKADKKAFKSLYGKRAMRTCVKGEKKDQAAETKAAKQACKDEQAADPDLFAETYGTGKKGKNAYGKCVSMKADEEDESDVAAFKNAAKACKAERKEDKDAFNEKWGTNKNKKNALGKCVSATASADDEDDEPTDDTDTGGDEEEETPPTS